ncbi:MULTISPECIES: hypothetical protein [Serratia]|jgi:hypothetical protein|uniref:Antirepressor protein C-terminal domain-containing protein n=1 Tax=Serratia proteamaculans (strain 568) TaxID=399741 RepID=A8GCV8_SERP5|nr:MULTISPECIES: hypothetical protein [Serratia]MBV6691272.1 hypothetical protein [Serratia quinivorans]CAI0830594.1 Uncharacterised protein [Serratia quinivorans]CAI1503467.1 Uncharacterised protein [Serratia quinivorans]CAI1555429.1 Uncharacterised protein [Serratia quinivorans]CAI1774261.1 Uncharacterised protein [Serratia quinivorans]
MNDSHDDEDIKGSYILANKPETPENNGNLPSLSEDCDRLRNLSDVGDTFGYGRTRFYQWCRGRGFLTLMNAPSTEMINAGYMVTTLSENGYSRVYVTQDGFNYVGNAFRDDIQKRMVKI